MRKGLPVVFSPPAGHGHVREPRLAAPTGRALEHDRADARESTQGEHGDGVGVGGRLTGDAQDHATALEPTRVELVSLHGRRLAGISFSRDRLALTSEG